MHNMIATAVLALLSTAAQAQVQKIVLHANGETAVVSGPSHDDEQPLWEALWISRTGAGISGPAENYRPQVSWTLFLANNGDDPVDYWIIVTHPLEVTVSMPQTMQSLVSATVRGTGDESPAAMFTIQDAQFAGDPVFAAYIDGVEGDPVMTLWDAPYLLEVEEPLTDATDLAKVSARPGPEASDSLSIWLKLTITPKTELTLDADFEIKPCPADCAPISESGIIGNGVVNVDDLLMTIADFGSDEPVCDPSPEIDPWTFGDQQVDVDDLLAVISAFGPCP